MLVIVNSPVPVGFVISTAFVAADVSIKTDTSIVCKKLLITPPFLVVVNGENHRDRLASNCLGRNHALALTLMRLTEVVSPLKGTATHYTRSGLQT